MSILNNALSFSIKITSALDFQSEPWYNNHVSNRIAEGNYSLSELSKCQRVMLLALFYYQFRSRMASKHTLRVFSLCAFLYRSEPLGSPNLITGEPLARRFYKIKQNEGSMLIIVSANQK